MNLPPPALRPLPPRKPPSIPSSSRHSSSCSPGCSTFRRSNNSTPRSRGVGRGRRTIDQRSSQARFSGGGEPPGRSAWSLPDVRVYSMDRPLPAGHLERPEANAPPGAPPPGTLHGGLAEDRHRPGGESTPTGHLVDRVSGASTAAAPARRAPRERRAEHGQPTRANHAVVAVSTTRRVARVEGEEAPAPPEDLRPCPVVLAVGLRVETPWPDGRVRISVTREPARQPVWVLVGGPAPRRTTPALAGVGRGDAAHVEGVPPPGVLTEAGGRTARCRDARAPPGLVVGSGASRRSRKNGPAGPPSSSLARGSAGETRAMTEHLVRRRYEPRLSTRLSATEPDAVRPPRRLRLRLRLRPRRRVPRSTSVVGSTASAWGRRPGRRDRRGSTGSPRAPQVLQQGGLLGRAPPRIPLGLRVADGPRGRSRDTRAATSQLPGEIGGEFGVPPMSPNR